MMRLNLDNRTELSHLSTISNCIKSCGRRRPHKVLYPVNRAIGLNQRNEEVLERPLGTSPFCGSGEAKGVSTFLIPFRHRHRAN